MTNLAAYTFGNDANAQRESLCEFAHKHRLQLMFFDSGSSLDASRGNSFDFALRAATSKLCDGLLVCSFEKLRRHGVNIETLAQTLRSNQKRFISITEDSPDMEDLGWESKFKKLVTARLSKPVYKGVPPFGFDIKNGALAANQSELEVIKIILKLQADRHSLATIAFTLNSMGHTRKRGKQWHTNAVFRAMEVKKA